MMGKLVDRTIDDDYEKLSERLFGEGNCYSSCEVRKRMYGMRAIIEAIEREYESAICDDDKLSVLDAKRIELLKERQKFFDQRREYNKLISTDGRTEHLYDTLAEAARHLCDTIGVLDFQKHLSGEICTDNEAVLVFGDWHYGMTTDNAFNRYNTEICKLRVNNVVRETVKRLELHCCSRLHIIVLGDLFHGAIHTSARVASEELVCEQIMKVSEILAQAVNELSRYVQDTFVYMTYGNHGRTIPNKNDSIHRDNLERIIPWWMEQRLKNNESIHIAEDNGTEFLFVTAAGHELCASHGDLDSVKTAPRLLTTLFHRQYGKEVEYILLGDKHHRESFEELGVTAIICGALCGSDDYANGKRLYSTPSQLLLIVNSENGVDAEYQIRCR